jgi:hypothetical protein
MQRRSKLDASRINGAMSAKLGRFRKPVHWTVTVKECLSFTVEGKSLTVLPTLIV